MSHGMKYHRCLLWRYSSSGRNFSTAQPYPWIRAMDTYFPCSIAPHAFVLALLVSLGKREFEAVQRDE